FGRSGAPGSSRRCGAWASSRRAFRSGWLYGGAGASAARPTRWRRRAEPRLGNERSELLREAAQAHLALPERPRFVARRLHSELYARDQLGVLGVDPAIDPPVEIARRLHFAALV